MTTTIPARAAAGTRMLDDYLRMLAGPAPGARLLEIRFALRYGDMGRLFIAAHSALGAARLIQRLAGRTDVYTGVCLRSRRAGGRGAIDRTHLAFVDLDTPDAVDRLDAFQHPPTMTVSSGTPGRAHAYWRLRDSLGVPELERTNRQLAHHLGADLASTDAPRILRPAGTLNHKHTPPTVVQVIDNRRAAVYDAEELIAGLHDPANDRDRTAAPQSAGGTDLDRLLRAIPAAEYVRALTGRTANRAGKVRCPLHADTRPSLQLYDDGTWYCFGRCQTGGSIYDFASRLWSISTKGQAFLELRSRLAAELGVTPTA